MDELLKEEMDFCIQNIENDIGFVHYQKQNKNFKSILIKTAKKMPKIQYFKS